MGWLEFVMDAQWQSSKNYINGKILNSEETTQLTKSIELNYKAAYIPYDENGDIRIQGFSFFCDNFLIYAEMDQDEFVLGLNNHTYLEFKRVDVQSDEKANRFQLTGVRSVDSLDQHQVILLQGLLMNPQVDFLSLK